MFLLWNFWPYGQKPIINMLWWGADLGQPNCSYGSLLVALRGPYAMLGIELEWAMCKASISFSLPPPWCTFLSSRFKLFIHIDPQLRIIVLIITAEQAFAGIGKWLNRLDHRFCIQEPWHHIIPAMHRSGSWVLTEWGESQTLYLSPKINRAFYPVLHL